MTHELQLISCSLFTNIIVCFLLVCLFAFQARCLFFSNSLAHFLECTNNVASKPKFDAVGILRIFAAAQNSFISRVQLRWKNVPLMEFRKPDYAFLMYFDCTG